ncbi:MAG: deoxyribodipyrimidine photo-lyase [Parachlamydiales bacterium]|jgi:deoxyribodipyrimidine photo-lyase
MTTTIVLFRRDLRIHDHPALYHACEKEHKIVPLFIWSTEEEGAWPDGGASKWWLHYSLLALQEDLDSIGLKLTIRSGKIREVLSDVIKETEATSIFWSRRYEPSIIAHDKMIKSEFSGQGLDVVSYNASLLNEPWTIENKQGKPYQVFTPYWKACLAKGEPSEPLPMPKKGQQGHKLPSLKVEDLGLLPIMHWDTGLKEAWTPGTRHALKLLDHFISGPILSYKEQRDFPAVEGISRLSPYLHFGEISPRMVWKAVRTKYPHPRSDGINVYLSQLGWREFGHHLLYHFPKTTNFPLREDFALFPWKSDPKVLKAWQKGLTGYPIVDAGMRQLWKTGWMHNRVRMIVGSFLVKDLLITWLEGAKWFWDTLVDADLANNTLGWQWVGGCGADAAPYFRIFNPISQGERFDSDGFYVKTWIPELAKVPSKWIHKPWLAPPDILKNADVELGSDYPWPIVEHDKARVQALAAFSQVRNFAEQL